MYDCVAVTFQSYEIGSIEQSYTATWGYFFLTQCGKVSFSDCNVVVVVLSMLAGMLNPDESKRGALANNINIIVNIVHKFRYKLVKLL